MGVPKFYRYISERYPCLSEVVRENQIPEFDNLYFDMNGIIHTCSHPNDEDAHFRISEENIFKDIFSYIETLFRIIKPTKILFMAVDGVAPRAKMNQQRGRRYRSAREVKMREQEAIKKGETLPEVARFDTNCITPGTEFMDRLQKQLEYFVHMKVTTDKAWRRIKVYLSGHETPGEGEHKIMDFIRSERSSPDYNPNTRHCLYGLDADLIMLGLSTHEPHFSLLREEIKYNKRSRSKRTTTAEEQVFHLLHLSLMREYIAYEFSPLKQTNMPFDFNLESIIDDWLLMGFLVGNDFIPHLPDLHIQKNVLPKLYSAYIQVLPNQSGYLNERGILNLQRFEEYLKKVAQIFDEDTFLNEYADCKWFQGKRKKNKSVAKELFEEDVDNIEIIDAVVNDVVAINDDDNGDSGTAEDDDQFTIEHKLWKKTYYEKKFKQMDNLEVFIHELCCDYVSAIQWNLLYYYVGCKSWSWYYPYHYAPYVSDLTRNHISLMNVNIELGRPFLPFQQLLAVLPPASKELLPLAYRGLMTSETSPVLDYYPETFETDLNGKTQDWEAVVLIPFIEEERLLTAMASCESKLMKEETQRNIHSRCLLYTYDPLKHTLISSPQYFADITSSAAVNPVDSFLVEVDAIQYGLLPGARVDVSFPGFPTLKHIKHKHRMDALGVKVFQQHSRCESVILTLEPPESKPSIHSIAENWLGKSLFVEWPHLREALVVEVSDKDVVYSKADEEAEVLQSEHTIQSRKVWNKQVEYLEREVVQRRGIEVGETEILLHVRRIVGRRYVCGFSGVVTLEKQWMDHPQEVLYQTCVNDIAVFDPSYTQFKTLHDLFPKKACCFMLGMPNYGCQGEVLEVSTEKLGRVRVLLSAPREPDLLRISTNEQRLSTKYMPAWAVSKRVGISSHLLSRITGTVFLQRRNSDKKVNIGLQLKFNKSNCAIEGYTRKVDEGWTYSLDLVDVLRDYTNKFPDLIEFLEDAGSTDPFLVEDITEYPDDLLNALDKFLKEQPCYGIEPTNCDTAGLDAKIVKRIEESVKEAQNAHKSFQQFKIDVQPKHLFRPIDHQGNLVPDPAVDHQLYDRVVNIRDDICVPLALRGTIVSIDKRKDACMFEILFDEEFPGGLVSRASGPRIYRLPSCSIINLSFGVRKEKMRSSRKTPVAPVRDANIATPYSPQQIPLSPWVEGATPAAHRGTHATPAAHRGTHATPTAHRVRKSEEPLRDSSEPEHKVSRVSNGFAPTSSIKRAIFGEVFQPSEDKSKQGVPSTEFDEMFDNLITKKVESPSAAVTDNVEHEDEPNLVVRDDCETETKDRQRFIEPASQSSEVEADSLDAVLKQLIIDCEKRDSPFKLEKRSEAANVTTQHKGPEILSQLLNLPPSTSTHSNPTVQEPQIVSPRQNLSNVAKLDSLCLQYFKSLPKYVEYIHNCQFYYRVYIPSGALITGPLSSTNDLAKDGAAQASIGALQAGSTVRQPPIPFRPSYPVHAASLHQWLPRQPGPQLIDHHYAAPVGAIHPGLVATATAESINPGYHPQLVPQSLHQNLTASPSLQQHLGASPLMQQNLAASPSLQQHFASSPSLQQHLAGSPSLQQHLAGSPSLQQHLAGSPSLRQHLAGSPSFQPRLIPPAASSMLPSYVSPIFQPQLGQPRQGALVPAPPTLSTATSTLFTPPRVLLANPSIRSANPQVQPSGYIAPRSYGSLQTVAGFPTHMFNASPVYYGQSTQQQMQTYGHGGFQQSISQVSVGAGVYQHQHPPPLVATTYGSVAGKWACPAPTGHPAQPDLSRTTHSLYEAPLSLQSPVTTTTTNQLLATSISQPGVSRRGKRTKVNLAISFDG